MYNDCVRVIQAAFVVQIKYFYHDVDYNNFIPSGCLSTN